MLEQVNFRKIAEKYNINTFYLFGSHYDGSADQTSDFDLAYLKTMAEDVCDGDLLYFDLKEFINRDLDLIDLRNAKLTFAFHIIKNSRIIYDRNAEFRTDFEDQLIMKHLDFSFVNNLMNQELISNFLEGESS